MKKLIKTLNPLLFNKIKSWNNQINTNVSYRLFIVLIILCTGFFTIFLANNVLFHINTKTWQYENPNVVPVFSQVGNDFRVGYYWPAQYLLSTRFSAIGPNGTYPSVYPPLVALTSLPYLLFDDKTAYLIHVGLIIIANLTCLGLATLMMKEYLINQTGIEGNLLSIISLFVLFLFVIYTFSSYFFAFSLERGNADCFTLFFSILAIWFVLKKPDNIWLQVILLSIAVHFKIYPAALFAVLLYKHGKKIILPAIAVNIVFLFIAGPKIAIAFIKSVTAGGVGAGIGNHWASGLNHAAYSLSMFVDKTSDKFLSSTFFVIFGIFTLIPLLLWAIAALSLFMKKYSNQNALLLLMVTIPMMDLVPTVSNDYKLVIECSAALLLIGLIIKQILQKYSWFDMIQLIISLVLLHFLSWSFQPPNFSHILIENKYLWVLLLEAIMVFNIIKNQKPVYKAMESDQV